MSKLTNEQIRTEIAKYPYLTQDKETIDTLVRKLADAERRLAEAEARLAMATEFRVNDLWVTELNGDWNILNKRQTNKFSSYFRGGDGFCTVFPGRATRYDNSAEALVVAQGLVEAGK